jgi:oxygen-independent coproporphyrinogen-3 oxidase
MERAAEYLMLGLRRAYGISREEYQSIYRGDFDVIEELLREFEKKGWARQNGDRWSLTASGFLLSNILIGALLEAQAKQRMSLSPWAKNPLENPGSEAALSYDARR